MAGAEVVDVAHAPLLQRHRRPARRDAHDPPPPAALCARIAKQARTGQLPRAGAPQVFDEKTRARRVRSAVPAYLMTGGKSCGRRIPESWRRRRRCPPAAARWRRRIPGPPPRPWWRGFGGRRAVWGSGEKGRGVFNGARNYPPPHGPRLAVALFYPAEVRQSPPTSMTPIHRHRQSSNSCTSPGSRTGTFTQPNFNRGRR